VSSLETRIADLQAREAIRELGFQYAWHVARGEGREMADLFTVDGVFHSTGSGHKIEGRENLRRFYPSVVAPGDTIPLVVNHIIRITGDSAEGTCKMFSPWQGQKPGFVGYYEDQYRVENGVWRIAYRKWYFHPRPEASLLGDQ
jgi:hypothetical protein